MEPETGSRICGELITMLGWLVYDGCFLKFVTEWCGVVWGVSWYWNMVWGGWGMVKYLNINWMAPTTSQRAQSSWDKLTIPVDRWSTCGSHLDELYCFSMVFLFVFMIESISPIQQTVAKDHHWQNACEAYKMCESLAYHLYSCIQIRRVAFGVLCLHCCVPSAQRKCCAMC